MKTPKAIKGLIAYLSDWKNLLAHGLVGVALVALPLLLPLPVLGRVGVFVAIVVLNLIRMRFEKRRKIVAAAATPESTEACP